MNIKHIREQNNMTQEQLAEKLSVDRSAIAKWESGVAMPRAEKLPDLARALNCDISDLYVETN